MKKIITSTLTSLLLIGATTCYAQQKVGSFSILKEFFIDNVKMPARAQIDFSCWCLGGGHFWCLTTNADLVKIDTTDGTKIELFYTPAYVEGSQYSGGICYDAGKLWIRTANKIIQVDTTGRQLPDYIDLSDLQKTVYSNWSSSISKDRNGFWLIGGEVIKIDMHGHLVRRFANAWFKNNCISLLDDRLLLSSETVPPKGLSGMNSVITIDTLNGSVIDNWAFPTPGAGDYLRHMGFAAGINCIWEVEKVWRFYPPPALDGIRIRKLSIPPPALLPVFTSQKWGDFQIVDWQYTPIIGEQIEGLHGLEYHNNQLWVNNGYQSLYGYDYDGGKYYFLHGEWYGGVGIIPRDICFVGDDLWIAYDWPGISPGTIANIALMDYHHFSVQKNIDVKMPAVYGIASNGQYIWVCSGSLLKKYDQNGNEWSSFSYAGKIKKGFEDLTWHQGTIWAITDDENYNDDQGVLYIYQIEPKTGIILREYKTGWAPASSNIQGNIASDGDHLVIISIFNPDGPGGNASKGFRCFENTHEVVLKLVPIPLEVAKGENIPPGYLLSQSYPNPFNSSITIEFSLPSSGHVSLKVYSLLGEQVAGLVDERLPAGMHKTVWNGSDLASGIYYYVLEAGGYRGVGKAILTK